MLKITLVLVKIYVLMGKKSISGLVHWIAAKHTADPVVPQFTKQR